MTSRTSHSLDRGSGRRSSHTCASSDTRYYSDNEGVNRVHQTSQYSTECDSACSSISSTDDEAESIPSKVVQHVSDSSLEKHLKSPLKNSNSSRHRPKVILSEAGLSEKHRIKKKLSSLESKQSQSSSVKVKNKIRSRGKSHLNPKTSRRSISPVKSESVSSRTEKSLAFTSYDSDTHVQSSLHRRNHTPGNHQTHADDIVVNNSNIRIRSTIRLCPKKRISSSKQLTVKKKTLFDKIFQSREFIKTEIHGLHPNNIAGANDNNCADDNIYIDPIYRPIYIGLNKNIPAITQANGGNSVDQCLVQNKVAITKSHANKCKETLKQELVKSLYKQYQDDMKRLGDKSKVTQFVIEAPGLRGKFVNGSGNQGILIADPLNIPNNKSLIETKKFVRRQTRRLKSELGTKSRKKSQLSTVTNGVYHRKLVSEPIKTQGKLLQDRLVQKTTTSPVQENNNKKTVSKPRVSSRSRTRGSDYEPRDTSQNTSKNSAATTYRTQAAKRSTGSPEAARNTSREHGDGERSASCSPTRKMESTEIDRSRSRPRNGPSPCRQRVNRKASQERDIIANAQTGRSASGSRNAKGETLEKSNMNTSSRQRSASPNNRNTATKKQGNREGNIRGQRVMPASDTRKITGKNLQSPHNRGTISQNIQTTHQQSSRREELCSSKQHEHESVQKSTQEEYKSPAKQKIPISHKQSANRDDLKHFDSRKQQEKEKNDARRSHTHNECQGVVKTKNPVSHQPTSKRDELQHFDGRKQEMCIAETECADHKNNAPSTLNSQISHKQRANRDASGHLDCRKPQENILTRQGSRLKLSKNPANQNSQICRKQSPYREDLHQHDVKTQHETAMTGVTSTRHELDSHSKRKEKVTPHQSALREQFQHFDSTKQVNEISTEKDYKKKFMPEADLNNCTEPTVPTGSLYVQRDKSSDREASEHTVKYHVLNAPQHLHYKENNWSDQETNDTQHSDSANESVLYTYEGQVRLISDSQNVVTEKIHEHMNDSLQQKACLPQLQNYTFISNPADREILNNGPHNNYTLVPNPQEEVATSFDVKNVFSATAYENCYNDALLKEETTSLLQNKVAVISPIVQNALPDTVHEDFVQYQPVQERHIPEMQNENVVFNPTEQEILVYDNQQGFEEAVNGSEMGDTLEQQNMSTSQINPTVYGSNVHRKITDNSESIFWDTLYDTDMYNEIDQESNPCYQNGGLALHEIELGKLPCEPQCGMFEAFNDANTYCPIGQEIYASEIQNNPLVYTFIDQTTSPLQPQNIFWENIYGTDIDGTIQQEVQDSVLQTHEEQRDTFFNELQNACEQLDGNQSIATGESEGFSYVFQNDHSVRNAGDYIQQQSESQNIRWEPMYRTDDNSSMVPGMPISSFQFQPAYNVAEQDGSLIDSQELFFDAQDINVENCPIEPEMTDPDLQYNHVYNLGSTERIGRDSQPTYREQMGANKHEPKMEDQQMSDLRNKTFVDSAGYDRMMNSVSPNVSNNISETDINNFDEHISPMLHSQIQNKMAPHSSNGIGFVQAIKTKTDTKENHMFNISTHQPYINSRLQQVTPLSCKENNFRNTLEEPNVICDFQGEIPQSSEHHRLNNVRESSYVINQEHHRKGMSRPNPLHIKPLQETCVMKQKPSVVPQQDVYKRMLHKPNMFCEMQKEKQLYQNTFEEPYLVEQMQPKHKQVFPRNTRKQIIHNPQIIPKIQKETTGPILYNSNIKKHALTEPNIIESYSNFRETSKGNYEMGERNYDKQISQKRCLRNPMPFPKCISQNLQSNIYCQNSSSQPLTTPSMTGHTQRGGSVIYLQNTARVGQICQSKNTHQDTFQKAIMIGNVEPQRREEQYIQNICRSAPQETKKIEKTNRGNQIVHSSPAFRKQLQNTTRVGHFQQETQNFQTKNGYSNILEGTTTVGKFDQKRQIRHNPNNNMALQIANTSVQLIQGIQNMNPERMCKHSLQGPVSVGQLEQDSHSTHARNFHLSSPHDASIQSCQFPQRSQNVQPHRRNSQKENKISQFRQEDQIHCAQNTSRSVLEQSKLNAKQPQRRQSPNNQNRSRTPIENSAVAGHHQKQYSISQHQHADQNPQQGCMVVAVEQHDKNNQSLQNSHRQITSSQSGMNTHNQRDMSSQTPHHHQTASQDPNINGQMNQESRVCHPSRAGRNGLQKPNVTSYTQKLNQNTQLQNSHRKPSQAPVIVNNLKQENQMHPPQNKHRIIPHQPYVADHARQRTQYSPHRNTHGKTCQGQTMNHAQVQQENRRNFPQNTCANTIYEPKATDRSQQRYHHPSPQNNYEQKLQGPAIMGNVQQQNQNCPSQKQNISQDENIVGLGAKKVNGTMSPQNSYFSPLQESNLINGQQQLGRRKCSPQRNDINTINISDVVSNVKQTTQNPCLQPYYRNASQKQLLVEAVGEQQRNRTYIPQNTRQRTSGGHNIPGLTQREHLQHAQINCGNTSPLSVHYNQGPQSIHGNKVEEHTIIEPTEQRRQISSQQNYYKTATNDQRQYLKSMYQPENTYPHRSIREPTAVSRVSQRRQIPRSRSPYRGTVKETTTIITQEHEQAPIVQTQKSIIQSMQCSNNTFERQHQMLLSDSQDLLTQMLPKPCVVTKVQRRTVYPGVCTNTLQEAEGFSRQQDRLGLDSNNIRNTLEEQQVSEMQRQTIVPHNQGTTR